MRKFYLVLEFIANADLVSMLVTNSEVVGPKYPPIKTMSPSGDCQAEWAILPGWNGVE